MKLAYQAEIRAMQMNVQLSVEFIVCDPSREFLSVYSCQGVHLCDLKMLGTK